MAVFILGLGLGFIGCKYQKEITNFIYEKIIKKEN